MVLEHIAFAVPSAVGHRIAVGGQPVSRRDGFALGEDLRVVIIFFETMPPFSHIEEAMFTAFGPPPIEEVGGGGTPEPTALMVRIPVRHERYQARGCSYPMCRRLLCC